MRKRHWAKSRDGEKNVRVIQLKADSVPPELLQQLYKLVLKLRPLYLAAGEKWDRGTKLDEMKNTEGLVYRIAQSGDQLLGFISYVVKQELPELSQPVTFIWELHVSPVAKRQGIGKLLIKTLMTAETADIPVLLRTFRCNKHALKFYESMGFIRDDNLSDGISEIMTSSALESRYR